MEKSLRGCTLKQEICSSEDSYWVNTKKSGIYMCNHGLQRLAEELARRPPWALSAEHHVDLSVKRADTVILLLLLGDEFKTRKERRRKNNLSIKETALTVPESDPCIASPTCSEEKHDPQGLNSKCNSHCRRLLLTVLLVAAINNTYGFKK